MAKWQEVSWAPPPEATGSIPLAAIHDYLTHRGWVQKASDMPLFRYYEHPKRRLDDGRPVHYYFPAVDSTPDYPLSVLRFIEAQARAQKIHPYDIFNELKAASAAPTGEPVQSAAG